MEYKNTKSPKIYSFTQNMEKCTHCQKMERGSEYKKDNVRCGILWISILIGYLNGYLKDNVRCDIVPNVPTLDGLQDRPRQSTHSRIKVLLTGLKRGLKNITYNLQNIYFAKRPSFYCLIHF